jgi:hypothetical protein
MRYERLAENFLGMLPLASCLILLAGFMRWLLIKGATLDMLFAPLISRLSLLPRFGRLARYADQQRVQDSRSGRITG